MTKKEKALNKAKETGKKIVEGGKELGTGIGKTIYSTLGALLSTFLSGSQKGISKIYESKERKEGISGEQKEKYKKKAKKYSDKSKAQINKAGELGKRAASGIWGAIKGGGKTLGYTAKASYHLIDAGDKAIGEKIEKKQEEKGNKPGRIGKFFRDNAVKLMIALSALGFGGYNTAVTGYQKSKQEIMDKGKTPQETIKFSEKEQKIKDFFNSPDALKDLTSSGKDWQDKRKNRYLGNDEAWNNMRNGFGYAERKKVIEGMCRMIESGHLEMVLKKADEAGVPRQCVFLTLAESGRQAGADSGVAGGYWQFTKSSAKAFGLIDAKGNDYRTDPEKSTDAAMKHLKDNYKIVSNYAKKQGYNMSESDKWIFAFHMYNGSPRLVKKGIKACKGDANKYAEHQTNTENRNYVPRILGIQDALYKIFEENGYDVQKIRANCLNQNINKTSADSMYEEFIERKGSLSKKERINQLEKIKSRYKEELDSGIISETYYNGAIRVIEEDAEN